MLPASAAACPAGISVTPVHSTKFYWDKKGNDNITGAFLGYKVTNSSGSPITSVSVGTSIAAAGNGAIKLGGGQPNSESIGTLASGSSAMAYFLVDVNQGPGSISPTTTLNYNSTSCTISETLTTAPRRALAANANKLFSARVLAAVAGTTGTAPSAVKHGSTVTVVVTGNTGTIGSGPDANREINLTPVVYPGLFGADSWRLLKVNFKSASNTCGASGLIENQLHISTNTSPSSAGCGGLYSASFTFQSRSANDNAVSEVQAFSYIASGNLIKHTSPFGSTIGLPVVNNASGTATTEPTVDLGAELTAAINSGAVGFLADELSMVVYQGENKTSESLTYIGGTAPISDVCLVDPANSASCGTGPYTVKNLKSDETLGTINAGTFEIVTVNGEKRVKFTASASYFIGGSNDTDLPARITMRLTDSSNPTVSSDAFANAAVIAGTPPTATGGAGSGPVDHPVFIPNVAGTGTSITECLFDQLPMPEPCSTTVTSSNGSWTYSASTDTVTYNPTTGFAGVATAYFGVTDANGAMVYAQLTATLTGPPVPTTVAANSISDNSATLNGTVSTGYLQTDVEFCWHTSQDDVNCTIGTPQASPLPAATGAIAVSLEITGLNASTTYYFLVRAANSVNPAYIDGSWLSFTTLSSAAIATTATDQPTNITSAGAKLKGNLNSNGASTDAEFCYRAVISAGETPANNSTFCDDNTTTKVAAGNGLNNGAANVEVDITGLEPYTEYVYMLRTNNVKGKGHGGIQRFTTSAVPPIPVTNPASSVTATSAVISGTVNPRNKQAQIRFCWNDSPTLNGCTRVSPSTGNGLGDGNSPVAASRNLTTLTPGKTYYYRIIGNNGVGGFNSNQVSNFSTFSTRVFVPSDFGIYAAENNDVDGSIQSFTTLELTATTEQASSLSQTGATLNGTVNPGGDTTTVTFCYSDTDATLTTCTMTPAAAESPLSGSTDEAVSYALTGLTAGTTYYFKVVATNSTQGTVEGAPQSFNTQAAAPVANLAATTVQVSGITQTGATLNGTVDPAGESTTVSFCFGTLASLATCLSTQSAAQSPVTGNAVVSVSLSLSGLTAATTYYYKVIAINNTSGTVEGSILSFTTLSAGGGTLQPPPIETPESDPCEPETEMVSTDSDYVELGLVGVLSELFVAGVDLISNAAADFYYWATGFDFVVAALDNQLAMVNPGIDPHTYVSMVSGSGVYKIMAKASPKAITEEEQLTIDEIVVEPGTEPNSVEIKTTTGEPVELLAVQSISLNLYAQFTGAELNNPAVWQEIGYGLQCWKLEPFSDTWFYLPENARPPGAQAGNWYFSNVIVKAGSITADPTTFQANTLFYAPKPGSMVWADVNGDGIYNPGGKTGDKAISHVVLCSDLISQSLPEPTETPTEEPSVSPTPSETPGETPSVSPTPSNTPTESPSPTETPTPTESETETPVPTESPAPTLTEEPLPAESPEPTQAPCSTPLVAEPSPTPSPRILIFALPSPTPSDPDPSDTPAPTPSETPIEPNPTDGPTTEPTPTDSPTPIPTDSPSPSPSDSPSPEPTDAPVEPEPTPTDSPSPTPTDGPSPEPTRPGGQVPMPVLDFSDPPICSPSAEFGIAMKLTNGLSTTCLRMTEQSFLEIAAFGGFEAEEEASLPEPEEEVESTPVDGSSDETVSTPVDESNEDADGDGQDSGVEEGVKEEALADTGADASAWLLVALMLMALGSSLVLYARRRA